MYKISEETKRGMHATPEELGKQLEGLPDDITRCSRDCPFSVKIRILPSTLTPLELEAFNIEAWEAWYNDSKNLNPYVPVPGEKGEEKINIEIMVPQRDVESLYVEIIRLAPDTIKSGQLLKRFQLAKSGEKKLKEGKGKVEVGTYLWEWDGYIDDVLDTKLLKDETTYIRAVGIIGSAFKDDAVQLLAQPFKECAEPVDWLDVQVNRNTKTVNVEWRVAFDDGHGKDRPANIPTYEKLVDLAIEGINYHWNRPDKIEINGSHYEVLIKPKETKEKAAPSLTLQVETFYLFNPARSVNSSCVCGVIGAIIGNIGKGNSGFLGIDTTKVWYLQKFYQRKRPSESKALAEANFRRTAAHEVGHPILASYAYKSTGVNNYSWVHKGSSKGLSGFYDTPDSNKEKGYEKYPDAEADLMKYYNYYIPAELYRATEYDIKSLLWLSRIKFGG